MTTPTPWKVADRSSNPKNGTLWRDLLAKSELGDDMYVGETLRDDAALIVTAVNNHARLMEENRVMRQVLQYLKARFECELDKNEQDEEILSQLDMILSKE